MLIPWVIKNLNILWMVIPLINFIFPDSSNICFFSIIINNKGINEIDKMVIISLYSRLLPLYNFKLIALNVKNKWLLKIILHFSQLPCFWIISSNYISLITLNNNQSLFILLNTRQKSNLIPSMFLCFINRV